VNLDGVTDLEALRVGLELRRLDFLDEVHLFPLR
jgi:hypothetical protein